MDALASHKPATVRRRTGRLSWPMALIAGEKFAGAILAAAVAAFAFVVHQQGLGSPLIQMMPGMKSPVGQSVVRWLVVQLTPGIVLWSVAIGGWSVTLGAEAVGVYFRRTWAEWLVVVETGGWIPVEMWSLVLQPSWANGATLGLNGVIFVYVLHRHLIRHALRSSG